MYVGADPGGSSDLISRQVATGLTNELGETFSVINRSGSNGALAAAEVEQAEPDGNIIAVQNASLFAITPLAVAEDEVTNIEDFDVVQRRLARRLRPRRPARAAASRASTTSRVPARRSPTAPPGSAPAPSSPAR